MLRVGVGLTLATVTVWTVACSSSTDPGARPRAIARQLVAGKPIPILRDAHVAALPVFDNLKVNPTGLNDLGQIVGDSATFTTFRWTPGGDIEILAIPDTGFFQAPGGALRFRLHARPQSAVPGNGDELCGRDSRHL